ncbi:Tyrosine-protein kinase CSK [Trichoplax sp. H2]|nr:Tyrosine-protein kinase CSK [Trichoplax sp. H2]|eukprot:RDD37197.1 Tyrosine-protein kinase CSK [Trichoplax sp. H2]
MNDPTPMIAEVRKFPPFEAGAKCRVLYGYEDPSGNSLSYDIGNVVTVSKICQPDSRWCIVTADNKKQGRIPSAILVQCDKKPVDGLACDFYHGRITREESEIRLKDMGEGTFLMRESVHKVGQYVMSVSLEKEIAHYFVYFTSPEYMVTIDFEAYFPTLHGLIQYYKSYISSGIPTLLDKALRCPEPRQILINYNFFAEAGWLIPLTEITHRKQISSLGRFGEVSSGSYRGREISIKSGRPDSIIIQEALLRQASTLTFGDNIFASHFNPKKDLTLCMEHLHHKNIIEFIGITLDDQQDISLVTEAVSEISLLSYVRRCGLTVLKENVLVNFARDICCGMCYISEKNFIYRDVALRNIALVNNQTAKISNFNFAMKASSYPFPLHYHCIKWMAPESIKDESFTSQSDIWSYGILLWELFSYGCQPYPQRSEDEILGLVEGGFRLDCPKGCPTNMYDIITSCWDILPQNRTTFEKIKQLLSNATIDTSTKSTR